MVKSKRAREAADSVVESTTAEATIDTSAPQDKKAKKRKRDVDDEVNGAEEPAASEKKKSKKDKKDKKSKKGDKESRKEKKEKRKDLQDLPEEVADEEEEETKPQEVGDDDAEAKRKEEKRARKLAKREEKKQRHEADKGTSTTASSKSKDASKANSATPAAPAATKENDQTDDPIDLNEESTNGKKDRHIVFVGNLPFSATAATISAHFASLSPVAVRCLRNRDDPNPCRGIAFVEFDKVWHMRTCLDKFHHSTFDDGKSPARKINVELTAGGGGKTKERQNKIKEKNRKLDENRAKRIEKEKVAKENGDGSANKGSHQEDSIHPSRRGRIPGGW